MDYVPRPNLEVVVMEVVREPFHDAYRMHIKGYSSEDRCTFVMLSEGDWCAVDEAEQVPNDLHLARFVGTPGRLALMALRDGVKETETAFVWNYRTREAR